MKWIETVRAIAETIEAGRERQAPVPAGWDPYEVWLHRVHAPRAARERRAGRGPAPDDPGQRADVLATCT